MERTQDTYKEPIVYETPTGKTTVYIPDLTPEERAIRLRRVHDAAAELLECVERARALREAKEKEGEACGTKGTR